MIKPATPSSIHLARSRKGIHAGVHCTGHPATAIAAETASSTPVIWERWRDATNTALFRIASTKNKRESAAVAARRITATEAISRVGLRYSDKALPNKSARACATEQVAQINGVSRKRWNSRSAT